MEQYADRKGLHLTRGVHCTWSLDRAPYFPSCLTESKESESRIHHTPFLMYSNTTTNLTQSNTCLLWSSVGILSSAWSWMKRGGVHSGPCCSKQQIFITNHTVMKAGRTLWWTALGSSDSTALHKMMERCTQEICKPFFNNCNTHGTHYKGFQHW